LESHRKKLIKYFDELLLPFLMRKEARMLDVMHLYEADEARIQGCDNVKRASL
jgi:hypothetical protein